MLKAIMDVLTQKSDGIARVWIRRVRKAVNLKKYNEMTDEDLVAMNSKLYRTLALWFEKEIDKDRIGAFFVELGKTRRAQGFPVSEVSWALLLSQRSVIEYIMNESVLDSSMALYTVIDLTTQVADFFFLGSYYMMKGYLEDMYIALGRDEAVPEETLKKYFRDDFFLKDAVKTAP